MFAADSELDIVLRGMLLAAGALVWIIVLIRLVGLRSLSKMTPFDFVMTIATGSLLAGAAQATAWSGFVQALVASTSLFLVQVIAALARSKSDALEKIMQNEPVFLMRDGKFVEEALRNTRVLKEDVFAKLREANALHLADVHAVVLETTGDISVLHGSQPPDEEVLKGVRKTEGDVLAKHPATTCDISRRALFAGRAYIRLKAAAPDPSPSNGCRGKNPSEDPKGAL